MVIRVLHPFKKNMLHEPPVQDRSSLGNFLKMAVLVGDPGN
jgi:hypothetical protein